MITNIKRILLIPLFGLLLSSNTFATTVDSGNTLHGINGLINVTEHNFCGETGVSCPVDAIPTGVEYSLDILDPNSTLSIGSVAISTNTMDRGGDIFTYRTNWTGAQFTPANWDDSFGFAGSFSSLFGNDLYVNYFSALEFANLITAGSDGLFEFFHFQGVARSNFIALGANGNIIDQSRGANTVPEPAPLALLGFGLLGIGLMRGRRTS